MRLHTQEHFAVVEESKKERGVLSLAFYLYQQNPTAEDLLPDGAISVTSITDSKSYYLLHASWREIPQFLGNPELLASPKLREGPQRSTPTRSR